MANSETMADYAQWPGVPWQVWSYLRWEPSTSARWNGWHGFEGCSRDRLLSCQYGSGYHQAVAISTPKSSNQTTRGHADCDDHGGWRWRGAGHQGHRKEPGRPCGCEDSKECLQAWNWGVQSRYGTTSSTTPSCWTSQQQSTGKTLPWSWTTTVGDPVGSGSSVPSMFGNQEGQPIDSTSLGRNSVCTMADHWFGHLRALLSPAEDQGKVPHHDVPDYEVHRSSSTLGRWITSGWNR